MSLLRWEEAQIDPEEAEQEQEIARWRYPNIEGYEGILACTQLLIQDLRKKRVDRGIQCIPDSKHIDLGLNPYERYILELVTECGLEECSRRTDESISTISRYVNQIRDSFY